MNKNINKSLNNKVYILSFCLILIYSGLLANQANTLNNISVHDLVPPFNFQEANQDYDQENITQDKEANLTKQRPKITAISLGPNCQVAGHLRLAGIQKEKSFPFDWMDTTNFDGLLKLFQENFKYFLHKEYLTKDKEEIRIYNTYYKIFFVHDFPTINNPVVNEFNLATKIPDNFLIYLDQVKEKFEKRIWRIRNLLKDNNHQVVLIRANLLPDQAKALSEVLVNRYPNSNFTVVSVHNIKHLDHNWNINRVKNFYVTKMALPHEPAPGQYFSGSEWAKVFKALNLIK